MSVTHAWSGPVRSNCRARTLVAMGNGCRDCVVTRNRRRRRAASPRTRMSRARSSRSSVVSAPGVPRPASISACRTQLRSAVSVRSSSRATVGTDLPLSRTSRTASALNSFVNARRFRLAMTHSYRTFVRSEVSTKPGQVQAVGGRGGVAGVGHNVGVDFAEVAAYCPLANAYRRRLGDETCAWSLSRFDRSRFGCHDERPAGGGYRGTNLEGGRSMDILYRKR